MRILVAYASKHGSTREIADVIGEQLRINGAQLDVQEAAAVDAVETYDGVILGSAVYVGHWLEPATEFVKRHDAVLASRPTWIFSSGPIGGKPVPEHAVDVSAVVEAIRPRDHRLFGGKIDKTQLGFAERALVLALRVPEGDFRDWAEITDWAKDIRDSLP